MLKLTLKPDWDSFPSYNKKKGHFVGRQDTKDKLINDFLRKSNGSILVSGARGVGKTALVYQALQEATEKQEVNNNNKIIPIILNAAQLDPDNKELKKSLLQGFIRRLYTALRNKDLEKEKKDNLNKLYKKSVAKETKISETSFNSESEKNSYYFIKENKLKIGIDIILFIIFIGLLFKKPLPEPFNSITLLLIFIRTTTSFSVAWSRVKKSIRKEDSINSKIAEETYITDGAPDNIEYDLNEFLESIKKDYKIIFVLDELDKCGDVDKVFKLIQNYKNLFNISSALFVFVTDHLVYNHAVNNNANNKNERLIKHTLFNDRLFLTRPNFNDLESFLEDIIEYPSIEVLKKDTNWDDFKNYLCFRCKTDFFDLYHIIRDYITGYDNKNRQILILENLDSEQLFESKIQKIIGQIYDTYKKAEPTHWKENNDLLSELYSFLDYGLNNMDLIFQIGCNNNNTQFIDAKKSLCEYLARLDILKYRQDETKIVNKKSYSFKVYTWTTLKDFEVPKTINTNLEYEDSYIMEYNHLLEVLNSILVSSKKRLLSDQFINNNIDKKHLRVEEIEKIKEITQFNFSEQLKRYKKHYINLKKSPPIHISKDELEKVEKEIITSIYNNIYLNINKIFAKCITYHSDFVAETAMIQNKVDLLLSVPELRQSIIDNNIKHTVLYNPDLSKQVIITTDINREILNDVKKLIKLKKNKIKLINFQHFFEKSYKEVHNLNTNKLSDINKSINTVGVINILVDEEFKTFNKTIQYLRKWFK